MDASARSDLFRHLEEGNEAEALAMIDANALLLEATNEFEFTPLLCACARKHFSIVQRLVSSGCNLQARDKEGNNALGHAIVAGSLNIVEYLLELGFDANQRNHFGFTAIMIASKGGSVPIVLLLMSKSALLNLQGKDGSTALFNACAHNHESIAIMLCDAGADVNIRNYGGISCLLHAAKNGNASLLSHLLLHNAQVDAQDRDGMTALMCCLANQTPHIECMEILLRLQANVHIKNYAGYAALHIAASWGHAEAVKLLITHGADVDALDQDGATPLMWACVKNMIECARVLLEHEANVNAKNFLEFTALMMTCNSGSIAIAQILIQCAVDVNAQDKDGWTALMHAAKQGHTDLARMLLRNKADIQIRNKAGTRAIDVARNPTMIDLLATFKETKVDIPQGLPIAAINGNDIILHEVIASTGNATVRRGRYRHTDVAIKILHHTNENEQSTDKNFQSQIIAELTILCNLRHPRIVSLLGTVVDLEQYAGSIALVTELMPRKSLYHILHHADTPPEHRLVCLSDKLKLLLDVATGMQFLHSSNVIHRDLKSPNILIDAEGRAKVCDFGASVLLAPGVTRVTGNMGTARWASPESMNESEVTSATDIYSYGVVIWEVLTNQIPWNGYNDLQIAVRLSRNEKLPLPRPSATCPAALTDMMYYCFLTPTERPIFDHICDELAEAISIALQAERSAPLMSPPNHFLCPITHELMEDPVMCDDGQTYERAAIEHWFSTQNEPRSPLSNAVLPSYNLRTNYAIRAAIEEFKAQHS